MGCEASYEMTEKLDFFQKTPFYVLLDEDELEDFAEFFWTQTFSAKQTIFEQDDLGHEFYILVEGGVSIWTRSDDPEDNDILLCSKSAGDFFGESVITSYEDVGRSATVKTNTDCTCLVIDRQSWQQYVDITEEEVIDRILQILGQNIVQTLRQIDFLEGLDDWKLQLLGNLFRYQTMEEGQKVFSEGDTSRELYIISRGAVVITAKEKKELKRTEQQRKSIRLVKQTEQGPVKSQRGGATRLSLSFDAKRLGEEKDDKKKKKKKKKNAEKIDNCKYLQPGEKVFARLNAGSYFGEIALMIDMPRTATVTATERSLLLVLGMRNFKNFLTAAPDIVSSFKEVVVGRITQLFQKHHVPMFDSIPLDRYGELGRMAKIINLEPEEILFYQGDPGDAFYLIVYGDMDIVVDGKAVNVLHEGDYFGEIALVHNSPRSATVRANSKSVLVSIQHDDFIQFFEGNEQAHSEFAIKALRDRSPLSSVLLHPDGRRLFAQHCADEYSSENINFWISEREYQNLPEHKLPAAAEHILNQHIVYTSTNEQVNIDATIQSQIEQRYRNGQITRDLFAPARNEILKLMSQDSYKRFKAGKHWKALLKQIGCYDNDALETGEVELIMPK